MSLWTRIVSLISLLLVLGIVVTGSLSLFLLNRTLIQSVDNDLRAGMSEMLTLAQLGHIERSRTAVVVVGQMTNTAFQ